MESGQTTGSRFGLKGSEKLNDTLSVRFVLEEGFDGDTGRFASKGRMFSRQSTLSLRDTRWGELAFGRAGKVMSGSDQFTRVNSFAPFSVTWGDAGLLFYGKGGRVDNGVFYRSPKWNGFTIQATTALQVSGDEEEKWHDNERYYGMSVDYMNGPWGILLGAEKIEKTDADAAEGEGDPTTITAMSRYEWNWGTTYLAYQYGNDLDRIGALKDYRNTQGKYLKATNVRSHAIMIGAKIPVGKDLVRLSALYSMNESETVLVGTNRIEADYWAIGLGYEHPLSKSTKLYVGVSHLKGEKGLKQAYHKDEGDANRTRVQMGCVMKF